MKRVPIVLLCMAALAALWPAGVGAQTSIGPVAPNPVAAFYLQGGSTADTATVTLRQGTDRSLNQMLLRVYDPDENEIARWYSRQLPGVAVPAAGTVLHTLEFALERDGVYQVRITHRGGNRLTAAIGSAGQLAWGVSFQNGAFAPWTGQPASFYFFVPPRAEELTLTGRHVRLYNAAGALAESWPSSDTTKTVAFAPADWETVWRADIVNLASWRLTAAFGMPLILCPSKAFAESLRASIEECADGTWVSHRFQVAIGAILDDLLGPAKRAETIGEAAALVRTLDPGAWMAHPDRNWHLLGSWSVFSFIRPALMHQFEYAGNPRWSDHWRHWGGAMGHHAKQPRGWHFWVAQPPPANRWDRWKYIVAPPGTSSNNTLVSGVSPSAPDARALAFAYAFDNAALNPYAGDERIKYRAAIAELRNLMALPEAEVWQASAATSYEGLVAFFVANSMPAYALLNQRMPADIQAVWTQGVGRLCDRVYTDNLATTRNQSSHHLVSFYEMYEGSLDPMRLALATDFAARFIEGIHPAGWAMEATGPDATYQGMTHWHMAVYYKKSGDEAMREALEKSYRFFNHTVAREPDGRPLGASNFSHRTAGGFHREQWGGAKLIADDLAEVGLWASYRTPYTASQVASAVAAINNYSVTPLGALSAPRYTYYTETPNTTARWPAEEPESFIRDVNDGGELIAVKRPAYYTTVYVGKPAGSWYIRERENFRPYTAAEHTGGAAPGAITPFLGGGLSLFATPGYGNALLAANWAPTTHHGPIATRTNGLRYWSDYHQTHYALNHEQGTLTITGNIEGLPIAYTRRYTFHDHKLGVELTLTATAACTLTSLVENIPILQGAHKLKGAALSAPTGQLVQLRDAEGRGVDIRFDAPQALTLVPNGLVYGAEQIGRVEVGLPATLTQNQTVTLSYSLVPIPEYVPSRPDLIAYEGFDGYALGSIHGQGGNGQGDGFGNNTWSSYNSGAVVADSLSYGPLMTSGGALQYSRAVNQWNRRNLASSITPADGEQYWVSYLVRLSDVAGGQSWAGLRWRSESDARGYWAGKAFDKPANWALDRPAVDSEVAISTNQTHLVVQLIEIANGEAYKWLWVNPAFSSLGGANLDKGDALIQGALHNGGNRPAIDPFAMLNFECSSAHNAIFDEVRLGTTYADVTPTVNEPPTLDAIQNLVINEGAGLQTVNLTGISPGPDNESDQTVTITALSSDTSIIPHPTANYTNPDTTGSLTFTPVASAFGGPATITVTVQDDGGTANGGVDTVQRQFTVTVNPATGSGIPWHWLSSHGLPTDGSVDHTDQDGDGFTVYEEWIARTDPTDPASFFSINEAEADARGGFTLRWHGRAGRIYRVYGRTNLAEGDWGEPLSTQPCETDGPMSYYTGEPSARLFRLTVQLAE